jgi:hypothetical protein
MVKYGPAVQDLIWSGAVQFGPANTKAFTEALRDLLFLGNIVCCPPLFVNARLFFYELFTPFVEGNYAHAMKIISKTPKGHPYYMFLIKIPLNYSYRERFISTKKFLSNIDVDKKFLEMYDIKWVSLDTVLNSIDNKRPLIKLRNVFEQTLVLNIKDIEKYLHES